MKAQQKWIETSIRLKPDLLEILSNDIFDLGAEGLEEANGIVRIYFTEDQWNLKSEQLLIEAVKKFDPEFNNTHIQIKEIPYQDWTESWKDNFKLFHLTDHIIIKPDWDNYQAKKGETVITISPKMAFGTGRHETTKLVMLMLQKYIKEGQRLLDAGTGSGILSILAAKLGAEQITAFDTDPTAVENSRENFVLNNIKNYNLFCGTLDDLKASKYDIIAANIDRNVLSQLAAKFTSYIKSGGLLIISGLLSRDEDKILTIYEEYGWEAIQKEQMGAWIVLVLTYT